MSNSLTIGIAWNGVGEIEAALSNANSTPFVTEILISPSNFDAANKLMPFLTNYPKVRTLLPGDTGIYSAYNKLINSAVTTHICFHGSDDFVVVTDEFNNTFTNLGADEMLVCTARFCTASGVPHAIYHHFETDPARIALGRHSSPATPEVIYPISALRQCGGADETFRIAGDADLYFRTRALCRRKDLEACIVEMRDGGASTTARYARTVWLENSRIARRHLQTIPMSAKVRAVAALNFRYYLYQIGGERFAALVTDVLRLALGKRPRYSTR